MAASCESPVLKSIIIFNQIIKEMTRCREKLAGIQSPGQQHQEDLRAARANLDVAWGRIFRTDKLSERHLLQKEIQDNAGELQRLERNYESCVRDVEAKYECQVNAIVRNLCEKLEPVISTNRCHQDPKEPQRNSQHSETELPDTNRNADIRKRKREWNVMDQQKDQQIATVKKTRKTMRSVHFSKVFQDGNAPVKHVIVQWPPGKGSWYTIRCEEHDLNFKDNPVAGAAAHIRSKKHGERSSDYATMLELFGTEVLGCNETLAEQNNAVARAAFKNGYGQSADGIAAGSISISKDIGLSGEIERIQGGEETNESLYSLRQSQRLFSLRQSQRLFSTRQSHQREHDVPEVVANPRGGQVYRAFCKMSKQWLAALLLPMGNLEDIGIPDTIEGLGLLEDLPQCYAYDSQRKTFSWKEGYEDNGPRVMMREFPVMFFDGSPLPSRSCVAWVSARDLQVYDASAQDLVEYNHQVLNYLEARKSGGLQKVALQFIGRDAAAADLDKPNQSHESSSSPASGGQAASEKVQCDTTAILPSAIHHGTATDEEILPRRALQTDGSNLSLHESPRTSPHKRNHMVPTILTNDEPEELPTTSVESSEEHVSQVAQLACDAINESYSTTVHKHPSTGFGGLTLQSEYVSRVESSIDPGNDIRPVSNYPPFVPSEKILNHPSGAVVGAK
ncbi:hypothetical protein S40288_07601 [Stachybotrys chartarum IBT 40288]|nr:hypothetical protein S40288_07601 [Stachybotrys chartarum IBT 40288]